MNTKKILIAFFSLVLMAGCASNQTDDSEQTTATTKTAEKVTKEVAKPAAETAESKEETEAVVQAALQAVFYFDFDQATLSADTRAALDAQAEYLKGSNSKVRLEGHADERGTRDYNLALGERRANAIANYLVINGVERYRLDVVSYGEEQPVAGGSSESSYGKNRRVEIK